MKTITILLLLITSYTSYCQPYFNSYKLETINYEPTNNKNKDYISPYFILFSNVNENFEKEGKIGFCAFTDDKNSAFNYIDLNTVFYMPIYEGTNKIFISIEWKTLTIPFRTNVNFLTAFDYNIKRTIIGFTMDKVPTDVLVSKKNYEDYIIEYNKIYDPYE